MIDEPSLSGMALSMRSAVKQVVTKLIAVAAVLRVPASEESMKFQTLFQTLLNSAEAAFESTVL